MAATAAQIAQLRRMVAEPTGATYTDEALAGYIEAHGLGEAGYDLHAAAADIWDEKAAALAANFDATADGASLHLSQQYQQAMAQAQAHRNRSAPAMVIVERSDAY